MGFWNSVGKGTKKTWNVSKKAVVAYQAVQNDKRSKCPRCHSENIQMAQNTQKVGGPGATTGCCCIGTVLFGPLGMLCSLCGAENSKTTTMRMCLNCGKKFK